MAFHAKDDLPEVRYEVFKLLAAEGDTLRFHAVICDKERVLQDVLKRNEEEPGYRYHHNELYDGLMRSLLQTAAYFLWVVQRFYEPRGTDNPDRPLRDERFLKMMWPQIGEIHDLHFGPDRGTFFNHLQPLTLEVRFGEQKRKKP